MKYNFIPRLENAIIVFGRFLRQAGCVVGSEEIMNAVAASSHIEIAKREDFRQALRVTLISNNKHLSLFNHLFDIYWRNPDKIENISDILRKLYESRIAQTERKSMKEQVENIYQKRADESNNLNKK